MTWKAYGFGQPFDWKEHCGGDAEIDLSGQVLRCWLDLNPLVAQSMIWQDLDPVSGDVTLLPYPIWPESLKAELDQTFFYAWQWLDSSLLTPFPIPPDPGVNLFPAEYGKTLVLWNAQQAKVLYLATVAHSLALEIGGFVPWTVTGYSPDDLVQLFSSEALFEARTSYFDPPITGYFVRDAVHAFPKTSFSFFVEQNIIRSTHYATIVRLLTWSGKNLRHYASLNNDVDGKTPREVALMHWQYPGLNPVQRMLAGTLRENDSAVHHWTHGCEGTSALYASILRALNIPAYSLYGFDGQDGDPYLVGHTVPVFPTIGSTMSHGDDILNFDRLIVQDTTPPPASVSAGEILLPWVVFVDWFYTHPDARNVGRQWEEVKLDVLTDTLLDLYCDDLADGLFVQDSAVAASFANTFTVFELLDRNLWSRLALKAELLGWCD